jgi:hypothetical protein
MLKNPISRNAYLACPASFMTGITVIVILSAVLFMLRLTSNISFTEPLHLITSGSEEQSFLSLWKFIHGQPVYTDPHKIPFTSSYLNWLFYGFYGSFIKVVLAVTRLSDAWIPTVGRLISVFFSAAGFFITRRVWVAIFQDSSRQGKWLAVLVPFSLFFGPLPAFWPLTTRPDMAAMVFEMLAFYFFIKEFQNRPIRAVVLATFFVFFAWSFKQANITVFLSLFLFCLIHDRRAAGLMACMMAALCSLTLWLGGPGYRESTLFSLPIPGFSVALGLKNLFYYLVECAFAIPGYLAIGAVFFLKPLKEKIQGQPISQLVFITALISFLYGGLTAHKIGASENYFIPASIFVTFFFFIFCHPERSEGSPNLDPSAFGLRMARPAFYFSLLINALLILAILFGIKGHVSKRYEHNEAIELLKCAGPLPRPIFSQSVYLNRPWMLGGESFIPGYTYWAEKRREQNYERGGIEGLITEGYFASLLLEKRRMGEMIGASAESGNGFRNYREQKSSCPSTHAVFIRTG